MKILKYFIACICLLSSFAANSQNKEAQKKVNTNLHDFFGRNIMYPEAIRKQRSMPAVWVEICISSKGIVDSIVISETSELAKSEIKATDSIGFVKTTDWVKNEVIRVSKLKGAQVIFSSNPNMTLLIPIIFFHWDGGSEINYDYKTILGIVMELLERNKYYDRKDFKYYPPLVVALYSNEVVKY